MRKSDVSNLDHLADVSAGIPRDVLAISVAEFAHIHGISVPQVYCEIAEGRLVARKAGARTLILREDAELWLRRLPPMVSRRGTQHAAKNAARGRREAA